MSVPDTHFIEEFGAELKAKCLQDEPPFCEVACPFHLPIPEMEEKWERGRFNAVYRTYQNGVAFPAIVSRICRRPCEEACILRNRGSALSLGELEKATVRLTRRTRPNAYNLPPKPGKAAIVGGGLSGLGCALRLCTKKYSVTIYEKADDLGGRAREMMDPDEFKAEICNQFREEHPELRLGEEVTDLTALREEYDVIYVATGRGGRDFGLQAPSGETPGNPDPGPAVAASDSHVDGGGTAGAFATTLPGVFFGGELTGAADPVYALAEGLRAALALERYLKTGLMNEPEDTMDTRLIIDPGRVEWTEAVKPADPAGYTPEEVAAEAKRCRRCSCDICQRECDLMRIQEKTPGRLYEEAYITVRPSTLANDGRWATRRIASCDQCGLCKEVCPQRIDMGRFLMQSHRGLKDTDAMPWAFHDYWLRDMAFSTGEAAAVIRRPGVEKSRYAFFPGCQFGASDPELEKKIVSWFFAKQPGGAVWKTCCGAPAVWAAEDEWQAEHVEDLRRTWRELGEPVLIFACPTCRKMFDRCLPEIPGCFLEEMVGEWGLPEREACGDSAERAARPEACGDSAERAARPEACGDFAERAARPEAWDSTAGSTYFPGSTVVRYAVFDPCAGRDYPELGQAVRRLADLLGVPHEDLPHSGDLARCCSYGGQYAIAAPDYAKRVKMERANESDLPYLTSCMNCRDTFASRGKENVHILDLVFGAGDPRRRNPTLSERRENRLALKAELLEIWCGRTSGKKEKSMELICSKELERKLSEDYILLSDMEAVVAHCEAEQIGILHDDGTVTGHLKQGHMTYWATYRPLEEGRAELVNGYAHRMNLEGE